MAHQEIEHTQIPARGINLHVAQVGKGEIDRVLCCVVVGCKSVFHSVPTQRASGRWSLDCSLMLASSFLARLICGR